MDSSAPRPVLHLPVPKCVIDMKVRSILKEYVVNAEAPMRDTSRCVELTQWARDLHNNPMPYSWLLIVHKIIENLKKLNHWDIQAVDYVHVIQVSKGLAEALYIALESSELFSEQVDFLKECALLIAISHLSLSWKEFKTYQEQYQTYRDSKSADASQSFEAFIPAYQAWAVQYNFRDAECLHVLHQRLSASPSQFKGLRRSQSDLIRSSAIEGNHGIPFEEREGNLKKYFQDLKAAVNQLSFEIQHTKHKAPSTVSADSLAESVRDPLMCRVTDRRSSQGCTVGMVSHEAQWDLRACAEENVHEASAQFLLWQAHLDHLVRSSHRSLSWPSYEMAQLANRARKQGVFYSGSASETTEYVEPDSLGRRAQSAELPPIRRSGPRTSML